MPHAEPPQPAAPLRRLRWRRLLTLLILTTVVAVCFVWWSHKALQQRNSLADVPFVGDVCPICGGKLTTVGNVTDDRSKSSKNVVVWNRSICGNMFYDHDSVICTECWHAHSKLFEDVKRFNYWERSSELADSFRLPLAAVIRQFPTPAAQDVKSGIVYSQKFLGTEVTESVDFWCTDSTEQLSAFRDYAQKHDLSIRTEQHAQMKNQVYVAVEAKPRMVLVGDN